MIEVTPGSELASADAGVRELLETEFIARIFKKDPTLWGPAAEAEASARLGWIDALDRGDEILQEATRLREQLQDSGVDRVVLSGMGGSSLAPEVICQRAGAPLVVLDSTHPERVRAAMTHLDRTALVVSSKSGSTVETRSHLAAFEVAFRNAGIDPSARVIVVTDPGSALQQHAESAGYRAFLADPNVGGRYSALTAFGIVPSVLAGADVVRLLSESRNAIAPLSESSAQNPALRLAAGLAAQLPGSYLFSVAERDNSRTGLGDWIEQLMAESSGKDGRGMLPIASPADAAPRADALPATMFEVELSTAPGSEQGAAPGPRALAVSAPLGAQFLLWELATAAVCRLIGVNPFDQPDVESAKVAARAALSDARVGEQPTATLLSADRLADTLSDSLDPRGFIVIQAFLDRSAEDPMRRLRDRLSDELHIPVALGFGPRYLHSTGQFHKGGPPLGVYLQIEDPAMVPLQIPGQPLGFSELIASQAAGDRKVLADRGLPVFRITPAEVDRFLDAPAGAS